MATLRNPRECTVCDREFNETDRRPRNLSCSHHLCGQCIDKLIIGATPFCPICRQYIKANTSLEFKVNFGVEDFMKFTSLTDAEEVEEEEDAVKEVAPMTRRMKKMTKEYDTITKQLMEDCQKRQDQLRRRIQNISPLKDDLNIAINKIETELKSKMDELIEENRKAIENLEQETNQLLRQMIEAKNKHRDLASVTEALGKTQSSMNAALCLGRADMCLNDVEEWMQNHELPPEQEDILKHATKVCRSTKEKTFLMIEVLNSKEMDANVPLDGVTIYKKDTLPEVEVLQGMNEQLKLLIEQGLLYAVQRVKGQTYCARFSIRGRHLYLHYLENKSPPENARTLPYKQVASLVEKSSVLTFIEIGSKEEKIGQLHIRLLQNSYRGKNFALLCTGMKENTYVNSKLLETWGKGQTREYVRGGDYEKNTGDGGAPLVPIAMQHDRKNDPWSAGSVWGRRTEDSQFCISTRDDPEEKISGLFGRVEEGLDVLKKAIDSYPNIKQLKITDCGLVLPCSSLQHVTLDNQQA